MRGYLYECVSSSYGTLFSFIFLHAVRILLLFFQWAISPTSFCAGVGSWHRFVRVGRHTYVIIYCGNARQIQIHLMYFSDFLFSLRQSKALSSMDVASSTLICWKQLAYITIAIIPKLLRYSGPLPNPDISKALCVELYQPTLLVYYYYYYYYYYSYRKETFWEA